MVFKISRISGKWYNENNIEVSLDTNTQSGKDVELWLLQGNQPDFFEGTPEEIAEANEPIVQNLKFQQYEELLSTDWYYTRYIETGQEVPLEIKQQRQEIRDKYNNLIREINNE